MPKTLADLKKALEAITGAKDLESAQNAAQSLVEDLDEFDASYKAELKTKNSEAKGLRDRLKATEGLQAQMDAIKGKNSKVLKALGLEEDVEEIDEALEAIVAKIQAGEVAGKGKTELEAKLAEVQKQINKLNTDLTKTAGERDQYKNDLATEKTKRQAAIKNQAILSALTEGKATKPKELAKLVGQYVTVNDEDQLIFTNDKGEEVDFEKGVKGWLDANPEFVSNSQKGGAGSGGGQGGSGSGRIQATDAQMRDPEWYAKNRQAVMEDRVDIIGG